VDIEVNLSPVHTGDYTRRKRRRQFVAEFGDWSRQCGQRFRHFYRLRRQCAWTNH